MTQLAILSLFLTGGRTQETLSLTKNNFDFNLSKHSIILNNMKLDKKYRVISKTDLSTLKLDGYHRQKFITEKVNMIRDSFPILKREPLAPRYQELIENLNREQLFPGMYRQKCYYYVSKAGKDAGIQVSDHWFRGQRTSQLQEEYLFDKSLCETYMGWTKPASDMYSRYGSTTWKYLETMMAKGLMVRDDVDKFLSKK